MFRLLFSPNSSGPLREKFYKCFEGLFRQIESEKQNTDINDIRLKYQTSYRSQGCIAVINTWVADSFAQPKELIADIISELDTNTAKITGTGSPRLR